MPVHACSTSKLYPLGVRLQLYVDPLGSEEGWFLEAKPAHVYLV